MIDPALRARVLDMVLSQGMGKLATANALGITRSKVRRIVDAASTSSAPVGERTETLDGARRTVEVKVPRFIETEADALKATGIDLQFWERIKLETRHYVVYNDGVPIQGTYIKVVCAPRTTPDFADTVATMVDAAVRTAAPRRIALVTEPSPADDALDLAVVADTHFGALAYGASTGHGDYDLKIADQTVSACAAHLIATAPPVRKRVLAFLGDVFHYDTPAGTTTSGTGLDRDSRHHKMIEVGTDACVRIVEASAALAPTDVIIVPGNHDTILTTTLARFLYAWFRNDARVSVSPAITKRQYLHWEQNLLMFDHGERAKKKLPSILKTEQRVAWGATSYAEIHTGHLHHELAVTDSTEGVVMRTHRTVCPPDQWHADGGFVDAPRGMQAFTYHARGGVLGVRYANPHLLLQSAA